MDLLRERAEFKGCLTRIKFDRLNFMGTRANSIRLSIKRTPSSQSEQDQSIRFPPKKFSAAIPKQNLTPHYCVRKFAVAGKILHFRGRIHDSWV